MAYIYIFFFRHTAHTKIPQIVVNESSPYNAVKIIFFNITTNHGFLDRLVVGFVVFQTFVASRVVALFW